MFVGAACGADRKSNIFYLQLKFIDNRKLLFEMHTALAEIDDRYDFFIERQLLSIYHLPLSLLWLLYFKPFHRICDFRKKVHKIYQKVFEMNNKSFPIEELVQDFVCVKLQVKQYYHFASI